MRSPLVTVLMPYRDEAPFLGQCLRSLARQTFQNFELVAVNDGSIDDSPQILKSLAHRFPRLVTCDSHGAGLVPALNLGLSQAGGQLIARADADDLYHPRRLELQVQLIQSGVDVGGSLVRFFPRNKIMEGFKVYERWINRLLSPEAIAAEIYVETPIGHPSLIIRRDLLDRLQGYTQEKWPEDFDLMLRAFQAGAVFGKVNKTLHFWRDHADRYCRTSSHYNLEAFIRCRCHHLARGPLAGNRKLVIWGAGPVGKKTAYRLMDEGISIEAFIDIDPRKIGGVIRGVKVHEPAFLLNGPFFVLSCVAKRNARYLVKAELEALGYRERIDFILAA